MNTNCARCNSPLNGSYYETMSGPVCQKCGAELGFVGKVELKTVQTSQFADSVSANNMLGATSDFSGGMETMGASTMQNPMQGGQMDNQANNPFAGMQSPFEQQPAPAPQPTPVGKPEKPKKAKVEKAGIPHGVIILGVALVIILVLVIALAIKGKNKDNNEADVNSDSAVVTEVTEPEVSETLITSETEPVTEATEPEPEFDPNSIVFTINGLEALPTQSGSNGVFSIPITYDYDSRIKDIRIAVDAKDIFNQAIPDLSGDTFFFAYSGEDIYYNDEVLNLECNIVSIYTDEPVCYANFYVYYVEFEDGVTVGTTEYEPGNFITSSSF